ncbi:MAG: cofactor-independent phosphoglycerate mutase [Archaeoglobus sp.]|nr:MAG: cofactor-independent phosphoglycerate mutase [Archaeoglobus sp.]
MQRLLLIPDGMADWKNPKTGKTPLEEADTPNMDFLAKEGVCGLAKTIPDGFPPGSDVANLTILGVDVRKYYTGRGPIEAIAKNINTKIAFRCNLVYVRDGVMIDYSGNRISDEEAEKVIEILNCEVEEGIRFYRGKSYRHVLAIDRDFAERELKMLKTTPPHDITGKKIDRYLPRGGNLAKLLNRLIEMSEKVLPEVTDKANMIWPWSGGKIPSFPKLIDKKGFRGVMISEVDLLQGIGKGLGMKVVEVEGVTGYVDTNYRGLAKAALRALRDDFVVLHLEGIDEAGHEGDYELKVEAIELYDEKIVGYLLDRIDLEETSIMLLPDHPTPVTVKTHVAEPVPLLLYKNNKKDDVREFTEKACSKGLLGKVDGLRLMDLLL